ncbi:MAG TPA: hypothetical protein ENK57_19400, partial [Polyangiaceae bacterium]|nr:hypothetical protein [Polyangiaceae bacterium]
MAWYSTPSMVPGATLRAIFIAIIPALVLFVARARRNRELWEIALDVPLAVAVDLALVLLLSRVMRLETAAMVSRGLWLVGGGAVVWRRRRRDDFAWPRAVDRRVMVAVALSVAAAVIVSMTFSRRCHGFDRGWHIPLATSLKGQTFPFANVYAPGKPLPYHFGGDVLGAMFQTFSGNVIHMTLALAASHDVMYGLAAASLALLGWWMGVRSPLIIPLAI